MERKASRFWNAPPSSPTKERHEFVLLSDVLGLSSLVDMLHSDPAGTSSSVLGPFHIDGAPAIPFGFDMKRHYPGEVVLATGRVQDTDGKSYRGRDARYLADRPERALFQPGRTNRTPIPSTG